MAKEPTELVKALVLRDFWPSEDETKRVRAGTVIEVSKDDLIKGMKSGIYEHIEEAL